MAVKRVLRLVEQIYVPLAKDQDVNQEQVKQNVALAVVQAFKQ